MKPKTCAQCGSEIEGKAITYRSQAFCSDECCEAFAQDVALRDEPDADDLDDDLESDFDDDFDEDDFDEDDFEEDDEDDFDDEDDDY